MVVIEELIKTFLDHLKFERRLSVHTQTAYSKDLSDWSRFLSKEMDVTSISQVNPSFIRSWLASLREAGVTPRSIIRKISALKSFYKFLLRSRVVSASPMTQISSPKMGKSLPVFIKEDEAVALGELVAVTSEDWKNSVLHEINASDPEGGAVYYSIIDGNQDHAILGQQITGKGQTAVEELQPRRLTEPIIGAHVAVVIDPILVACVVRRVDVDHLHFALICLLKKFENLEVVAFNDQVFSGIEIDALFLIR